MLESHPSREELIAADQQEINRELGRPDTPITRPRALGSMEPQSCLVTYLPEDLLAPLLETFRAQGLPEQLITGGHLVAEGLVEVRWTLELVVPLTVAEGEAVMSLLVSDRMESPLSSGNVGVDQIAEN
jgi:hypothetical protein